MISHTYNSQPMSQPGINFLHLQLLRYNLDKLPPPTTTHHSLIGVTKHVTALLVVELHIPPEQNTFNDCHNRTCFNFMIQKKTRPTYQRTDANLYPLERQLAEASEPSFDLKGGAKG